MEYGTGAIFGCPAHDQRDFDFAIKYKLAITPVVLPPDADAATYKLGNEPFALTPEQSQARVDKAKAELQSQNPFLARHWKDGSETYDKMIRARVIRALAVEPMDLILIDPDFHAKYPWYCQTPTQNLPL